MRHRILATITTIVVAAATLGGCGSPPPTPNGFIDKTGKLTIDLSKITPKPIAVGDFSEGEGLAPVKFADGFGAIDKNGTVVFKKQCLDLRPYSEGKAAFCEGKSAADAKWGYLDKKGQVAIKPVYAGASKFSEGVAAVKLNDEKASGANAGKWMYIDETGKPAIKEGYDQADPFTEGLAAVRFKGRMGTINRLGAFVVPPQYDVVYACNDGNIVAAQGTGLSGPDPAQQLDYFDKTGKKSAHKEIKPITLKNLRPMMWELVERKPKGSTADDVPERPLSTFASPGFSETKSISQAGNKFTIDQQFNARAFKGGYDYIYPCSGGFIVVYSDDNGGKMDYRGGVPEDKSGIWNNTAFRYWDCAPFSDGLGLVQETKNGPYGYVDKSGTYVLQPTYDHARPFHDDLALVGEMAAKPY